MGEDIELAQAVADVGTAKQFDRFLTWDAQRAPLGSQEEFLAFCGTVGLGRLAAEGNNRVPPRLRKLASDPRWRIREGVAIALQRLGLADMGSLVAEMRRWAKGNDYERRARLEGFGNARSGSCRPLVLMDQATQDISALDRPALLWGARPARRRGQAKPSMRPFLYVVVGVGSQDARIGVRITRMLWEAKTSSNGPENFASRSLTRNRTPSQSILDGQVPGLLGDPGRMRMDGRSGDVHPFGVELDEEQHPQRPQRDGLYGEEIAHQDPCGLERRNSPHVGPPRRGAGSRPPRSITDRTVVAENRTPSLSSSPRMRWYPHRGLSLARRRMRAVVWPSSGGRPGLPLLLNDHFRRTSSRCHRSSVPGRTMNDDQSGLGNLLLAAARSIRSDLRRWTRFTCRRSILTWWRSTSSSISRSPSGS
jgi:hypothetical protein